MKKLFARQKFTKRQNKCIIAVVNLSIKTPILQNNRFHLKLLNRQNFNIGEF